MKLSCLKISSIAIAAIAMIAVACSPSTRLISSWKSPEVESAKYDKLMVFAIFPNMQTRVIAEDAMIAHFKEKGIKAIPSYRDFPLGGMAKQFMGMEKDSAIVAGIKQNIKDKIAKQEADGLIFISAFDVQKTKEYHQGSSLTIAGPAYGYYPGYYGNAQPYGYRGSYYDYYAYAVGTVYGPGYYTESTTYYLQSNLFDVKEGGLVWAGQTKTVNYSDLEREADLLGRILVNDIVEKKVIAVAQ